MKIKICGLTRPADIEAANRYKPDYIGLVFAESKRKIDREQARLLKSSLDTGIKAVGVFVGAEPGFILSLCQERIIDLIQLHGDEDERYIEALKNAVDNPIVKAVRVQNSEQILQAERLPCDYLLLDTFVPGAYGGSGVRFDPSVIPAELKKPYFLAGGLTPETVENMEHSLYQTAPYALDVSSGAETNGVKDAEKIRRLAESVRRM